MQINGSKGAGVSLEDALREFVAAIVREELKTDWPKVAEAETINILSDAQWKDQQKISKVTEGDDFETTMNATVANSDDGSEDDSPEPDAVPTMGDAVARAKGVMTEDGGKARLKTALSAVGATRVSAIPEDKITEFMEALDD